MPSTQTDRLRGLTTSVAVKAPVLCASTGNLVLSSTQVIDGVTVSTGDRVLVKDQTTATENGIYIVDPSTWSRADDVDGTRDLVLGTLVFVTTGSTDNSNFERFFIFDSTSSTSNVITPGTDAMTIAVSTVLSVPNNVTVSAFAETLLDDSSAIDMRDTLGFLSTGLDNALIRADSSDGLYQDSTWTLGDASTLTAGGPFLSSDISMADNTLSRPTIIDYGERVNVLGGSSATAIDIDLESGNVVSLSLLSTTARNFTFSNPPGSTISGSFTLFLTSSSTQDTVTWPTSVIWPNGSAPVLTSSGVDVLTFVTLSAGTTWYGLVAGQDFS